MQPFKEFQSSVEGLRDSLCGYTSYLLSKSKYQRLHHLMKEPSANTTDNSATRYIRKVHHTSDQLQSLNQAIQCSAAHQPIYLGDFVPTDRRKRYILIREIEKGLLVPTVFFTYTPGGSIWNHHFIWRVPDNFDVDAAIGENQRVMDEACGARTTDEGELDKRITEALQMEDSDIIIDLRQHNIGRQAKYDVFWGKCSEFLQETTAVHERRHGDTCFMAKAISVRDLIAQVAHTCPEGTQIPSESWVKYNFSPRNPRAKSSSHYTGRLKVRRQVQRRLYRKEHLDGYYCAALYRYLREFAVMYRDVSVFVSVDDKHRIKVGEPGFPLAAVERGKVSLNETFCCR